MVYEVQNGEFTLSTDRGRLDREAVFGFMAQAYWAKQRPREVMAKAIDHSLCFGLFRSSEQVGFARAITDLATYGYLADVFIKPEFRGRGLGKWLIASILSHPELRNLRRWGLLTEDAHELYRQFGFCAPAHPDHIMERVQPYSQSQRI